MIHAAEQETERVPQKQRREYQAEIMREVVERLKFLDELGSLIAMTGLFGRTAPGRRVVNSMTQNVITKSLFRPHVQ